MHQKVLIMSLLDALIAEERTKQINTTEEMINHQRKTRPFL